MAEANVNMKVEETTTESTTEQPVEQPAPAQRQVSLLQIPVNTENLMKIALYDFIMS